MSKVWKWIIGIVLGLVVLAVLVGVGMMVMGNFHVDRLAAQDLRGFSQRGPGMMPFDGFGHMRVPGMMGYHMQPFGGFMRGLFCLGFLAFVVLGIIWLVRMLRKPAPVVAAAVPVAMPAEVVNPCQRCGRPLQDEWKVCPHCGKKV